MTNHKLRLVPLPHLLAVCRLESNTPVPAWATSANFFSITRTADELSIVCPQDLVSDNIQSEPGWRCLRVAGAMDFLLVGVVASLVAPLAHAGISVFVISTFNTDYLLVKDSKLEAALSALRAAGHEVA